MNAHNISFHALGVTRWEDLQRFLADVQEGTVTREEFESGNFCILVLSPLREQDDMEGIYLPWYIKEMVKDSDIRESQIKAGDQLSVTYHGKKEVQTEAVCAGALQVQLAKKIYIHLILPAVVSVRSQERISGNNMA